LARVVFLITELMGVLPGEWLDESFRGIVQPEEHIEKQFVAAMKVVKIR
jgi:hypothetical protein